MVARTFRFANKAGTTKMHQSTTTAGIDTGKHTLDVALDTSGLTLKADNTPKGWRQIARFLKVNNVHRPAWPKPARTGIMARGLLGKTIVSRTIFGHFGHVGP